MTLWFLVCSRSQLHARSSNDSTTQQGKRAWYAQVSKAVERRRRHRIAWSWRGRLQIFSLLSRRLHLLRFHARDVFAAYRIKHGAVAAISSRGKIPPRPRSGRWVWCLDFEAFPCIWTQASCVRSWSWPWPNACKFTKKKNAEQSRRRDLPRWSATLAMSVEQNEGATPATSTKLVKKILRHFRRSWVSGRETWSMEYRTPASGLRCVFPML